MSARRRNAAHAVPASRRVLIIACGALAREIGSLIEINRLAHVDLRCLPALYHNRPERIAEAVRSAIRSARPDYDEIAVAYADCGTGGGLDRVLAEEGARRLPGAHCYGFYAGGEALDRQVDADMRSFFLTDFLARHFESLVVRPLALDRHPELLEAYFGAYEKVVYLAQSDDDGLTARAEAAAHRLGLAFERRFTGLGALEPFVAGLA
jgi:hypothetical protein